MHEKITKKISELKGYVRSEISILKKRPIYTLESEMTYEKVKNFDGEKDALRELIRLTEDGDKVYDIGANFGLYTIPLSISVKSGSVYSFEPIKRWFNTMIKNLCLNEVKNVQPFQIAMGKSNESVKMVMKNEAGSGMASYKNIEEYRDKINGAEESSARVCTIDDMVRLNIIPIPKIIKIDVEGSEIDVLRGGKKTISSKRCKVLLIEIHNKENEGRINDMMKDKKFKKNKCWKRDSEIIHLWLKN